jgi:hypothetical protein
MKVRKSLIIGVFVLWGYTLNTRKTSSIDIIVPYKIEVNYQQFVDISEEFTVKYHTEDINFPSSYTEIAEKQKSKTYPALKMDFKKLSTNTVMLNVKDYVSFDSSEKTLELIV